MPGVVEGVIRLTLYRPPRHHLVASPQEEKQAQRVRVGQSGVGSEPRPVWLPRACLRCLLTRPTHVLSLRAGVSYWHFRGFLFHLVSLKWQRVRQSEGYIQALCSPLA